MDWNTFMAQMNARLTQYNANGDHKEINNTDDLQDYMNTHPNESNYTYYIGYDTRHYYTATDARKIAGASTATFSITCHDGGTLGKGSTTYKCDKCGRSVSEHTKSCSMRSTLNGDGGAVQTGELQSKLTQLQQEVDNLQRSWMRSTRKTASCYARCPMLPLLRNTTPIVPNTKITRKDK